MTITAATPPAEQQAQVVWLPWDDYLGWLAGKITDAETAWGERVKLGPALAPGQHMALIGPTGCAKTTHAVGVLGACRKYVLALDVKGEDETLAQSGYVRVKQLPRQGPRSMIGEDQKIWRRIHKRIDDGQDARVIVGGGARTDAQDVALQGLMRESVTYARHAGGWTLYIDEFELMSSQRMFKLGPMIERMLITARRDKTSVVTTFQAPAWVSKHATRQATKGVIWPQDTDMVKNIARGMGRDWRAVAEAVDQLPQWHTLTIGRGKMSGPMVITSAPELGGKQSANAGNRSGSQESSGSGRTGRRPAGTG